MTWPRRSARGACAAVILALVLALSACGGFGGGDDGNGEDASTSEPSPTPTPTLEPSLEFILAADEPAPDVKRVGITFLQAALTYGEGEQGAAAAAERVEPTVGTPEALAGLAPLVDDARQTAVDIVYPQLGGLTADQAAIIAVIDLRRLGENGVERVQLVLDLRLELRETGWIVVAVESAGGGAAPRTGTVQDLPGYATASPAVQQLLADGDISISDTSAADLLSGTIDDRVVTIINDFAQSHTLGIAVVRTGHSHNVFGKSVQSNHAQGRAIDVWQIDGRSVAAYSKLPMDQNPARLLMEAALAGGSDEVGGPWAFSTPNGSTFTNEVHLDHVHVGFKRAS